MGNKKSSNCCQYCKSVASIVIVITNVANIFKNVPSVAKVLQNICDVCTPFRRFDKKYCLAKLYQYTANKIVHKMEHLTITYFGFLQDPPILYFSVSFGGSSTYPPYLLLCDIFSSSSISPIWGKQKKWAWTWLPVVAK